MIDQLDAITIEPQPFVKSLHPVFALRVSADPDHQITERDHLSVLYPAVCSLEELCVRLNECEFKDGAYTFTDAAHNNEKLVTVVARVALALDAPVSKGLPSRLDLDVFELARVANQAVLNASRGRCKGQDVDVVFLVFNPWLLVPNLTADGPIWKPSENAEVNALERPQFDFDPTALPWTRAFDSVKGVMLEWVRSMQMNLAFVARPRIWRFLSPVLDGEWEISLGGDSICAFIRAASDRDIRTRRLQHLLGKPVVRNQLEQFEAELAAMTLED